MTFPSKYKSRDVRNNMKKRNTLILALTIAMASGAYFYFSRDEINVGNNTPADAFASMGNEITPVQIEPYSAFEANESSTINALAFLSNGKRASDVMPIIWPLAREGHADAIVAIFELMSRCGQFYGEDRFKPKNRSEPTSPAYALREAAIKRNADYCNDANTHKIASAERKVLRDLLKLAALQGDEIALAYELVGQDPSAESAATARRLAKTSKEPWVVEQALLAMSSDTDEESQFIDEKIFSATFDSRERRGRIKGWAARWKACSIGASFFCKSYNRFQESLCMHEGSCFSHLNAKDFIKQRELSQDEYEKMLLYLEYINKE